VKILAPSALLLAAACANAAQPDSLTLEKIMADPDWIGAPVVEPYWSVDGRAVYYSLKRKGSKLMDLHRIDLATAADAILEPAARANADMPPVYDRAGARAAFVRNGDVFVRVVACGKLQEINR